MRLWQQIGVAAALSLAVLGPVQAQTAGGSAAAASAATQALPASKPYVIAQTYTLQSQVLNEQRELNIMLPEGYHEHPEMRYPVVYLLDGGQHEDFTHMAGAVQYASFSWVQRLPPVILVGIANTDRKRDMTFKASPKFVWPKWMHAYTDAYKNAGGSDAFIRYIETEVQPYVQQHFRTGPDKMLVGQSLAALLATEILLKKPALFNQYVMMSPSLWWDNQSLLKQAPQLLRNMPAAPMKVYLAVGNEGPEMVNDARALAALIRKHKPRNTQFVFEYLPKEDHGTILHPATLNAFAHFFPRPPEK
ncbi:alpha/beta hydrolase [Undibacterium squillarum]|uniref:alpha/beta hydrolase n=1 Tax=Undibacterium squillarum TaxID=1131567 RepID=UPI0035AE06FD